MSVKNHGVIPFFFVVFEFIAASRPANARRIHPGALRLATG